MGSLGFVEHTFDCDGVTRSGSEDRVCTLGWDACWPGTNTEKNIGWTGPCPPPVLVGNKSQGSSAKTYRFKLYALDTEVELESSATKNNLLMKIDGHILAGGELTGDHISQKQCLMAQGAKLNAQGLCK